MRSYNMAFWLEVWSKYHKNSEDVKWFKEDLANEYLGK